MKLETFKEKLKILYEKSMMPPFLDWPFVYDEDEEGNILVTEDGDFYFSDYKYNWIESSLKLDDVKKMSYKKYNEDGGIDSCENYDELTESYIFIRFNSGEKIEIFCRDFDCGTTSTTVYLHDTEENKKCIQAFNNEFLDTFSVRAY